MTVDAGPPEDDATAGNPAAPREAPKPTRRRAAFGCAIEIIETLVLTVVIFLGIQVFVAQPFKVEGGSMEMTLLDGQFVLVDKLTPRWATYVRGDIVVLDPPVSLEQTSGTPFIKRVIGLPGDRVELRDGTVYVNGAALDEPYIFTEGGVRQPTDPLGGPSEWLVPGGQLLVLGDHRMNSSDSRRFGSVEISHVIGRAWLRYWPLDTFGTLALPSYSTESGGLIE